MNFVPISVRVPEDRSILSAQRRDAIKSEVNRGAAPRTLCAFESVMKNPFSPPDRSRANYLSHLFHGCIRRLKSPLMSALRQIRKAQGGYIRAGVEDCNAVLRLIRKLSGRLRDYKAERNATAIASDSHARARTAHSRAGSSLLACFFYRRAHTSVTWR